MTEREWHRQWVQVLTTAGYSLLRAELHFVLAIGTDQQIDLSRNPVTDAVDYVARLKLQSLKKDGD